MIRPIVQRTIIKMKRLVNFIIDTALSEIKTQEYTNGKKATTAT